MRIAVSAIAALLVTGCGEAVKDDHFQRAAEPVVATAPVRTEAVPVRIGELGPSFAACGHQGTTRRLDAGGALPVRAAPFDSAAEVGRVAAGTRFFICARSHDQRWMGVVYEPGGTLAPGCGVSAPIGSRRDYLGPCRSGWVSSAAVKLVAG